MKTARDIVEDFFAGPVRHRLPAPGQWREGNRPGEYRMRLPVEVDDEVGLFELDLISTPDSQKPGVRFVLLFGRAVFRLDHHDEEHTNPFNHPADVSLKIFGPHFHSWADNARFGTEKSLPKALKNARPLPEGLEDSSSAFQWFLNQTNILPPDWPMPEWPRRTLLL